MPVCTTTPPYTITLNAQEAEALHAVLGEMRSTEFEHSALESTLQRLYTVLSDAGITSDDAHYYIDKDGDLRFSY